MYIRKEVKTPRGTKTIALNGKETHKHLKTTKLLDSGGRSEYGGRTELRGSKALGRYWFENINKEH